MPVSTRQATPGPSNLTPTIPHPVNAKKRAGSEGHEGARDSKKIKIDGDALSHISQVNVNVKDKKKKKRKKRKRMSVVKHDFEAKEHTGAKSASVTLLPSKHKATVPSGEYDSAGEAKDLTNEEEEDRAISSSSDKGKGKAKSTPVSPSQRDADLESNRVQPIASGSSPHSVATSESTSQASEITRLKEQLAAQTKLLDRHQTHLSHQQQSLTCQICLDLMYKPYALSPCGHITCYGCLVRWFTAPQNPEVPPLALPNGHAAGTTHEPDTIDSILNSATARNGSYVRRRKKCPVCRAVVVERPVEMWGIKDMVSALVRSRLVDLPPAPIPTPPIAEPGANTDPWRNVFRRAGSTAGGAFAAFFPFAAPAEPREQDDGDREQMGWFDAEDGGIHRCIDCYHEIWDGICSACHRHYPGHGGHNDDDDDDDDDMSALDNLRRITRDMEFDTDESDDGDDLEIFQRALDRMRETGELSEDDEDVYGEEDDVDDQDAQIRLPVPHYHQQQLPNYQPFHPHPFHFQGPGLDVWGGGGPQIVEVDEDEEEDSDYGGSFIDDDDDDEEVEVVEVVDGPVPRARSRLNTARRRYIEEESDEDAPDDVVDPDEDEDEDATVLNYAQRRRAVPRRVMDDSDSGESDDAEVGVDVDDDDDENDEEDAALALQIPDRYPAARGVYISSGDEEEDSDGSAGWW